MRVIRALLLVRWQSFRNALTRGGKGERGRALRGLLFTLLVGGGVAALAFGIFGPLGAGADESGLLRDVLVRLPALAFFAAFWLLLLSSVTAGIQSFYLNPEMPLLLSAPVPPRVLFAAKFLDATFTNAAIFLLAGIPVLLAYGSARHLLGPAYVVEIILVLAAFSALPTGIGVLAAILLMRVLPAGRTRDALGALGVTLFACLYFVISSGASRFSHSEADLRAGAERLHEALNQPIVAQGPWAWAGGALNGLGGAAHGLAMLGLLWLVSGAVVAVCAVAAQTLHARGWMETQQVWEGRQGDKETRRQGDRRPRSGLLVSLSQGLLVSLSVLPGPVRGVLVKDLRTMMRDLRQLSMLLMPLAVTGVFVFNFAEQPNLGREAPLLVVEILLVLLAPIALRLALAGFVAENRAFWITMAAPCDPGAVLAGKFAFAYALSLALGGAATAALAAAAHIHGLYALLTLGLLACAMASFCGIGVAASAMFADLSVENARFTVPAAGRMVIFGGQIAYTVVLGLVLGGAWALVRFAGLPTTPTYAGAGVLVPIVSAAFVLLPMAVAARKLRRMEW